MATFTIARDDIAAIMKTAWEAPGVSSALPLLYGDKEESEGDIPDDGTAWGRLEVKFSTSRQAGHGDGVKRWNRTGFVFMNLYTVPGDGNVLKDQLIKIVLDTFEGTSTANGVLFEDSVIGNKGIEDDMRWTRISVAFEFDEVK